MNKFHACLRKKMIGTFASIIFCHSGLLPHGFAPAASFLSVFSKKASAFAGPRRGRRHQAPAVLCGWLTLTSLPPAILLPMSSTCV